MSFVITGGSTAVDHWKDLRKRISKVQIGHDLFSAMDASAHTCNVSFVPDVDVANDGGAVAGLERPDMDKVPGVAMLKHFAPNNAVLAMASVDRMKSEIATAWKYYLFNNKRKNKRLIDAIASSNMGLRDICDRLGNVHLDQGMGKISPATLQGFMTGPVAIPGEVFWRLTWLLRPFIQPGIGASTRIRIAKSIGKEANSTTRRWRAAWGSLKFEDGHIICFHELVHAQRMMAGERVVDTGWEEEAMTIGLAPFEHEHFTENKYRQACGKQLATMHGSATFSSQTMAIQSQSPNDWGRHDRIFY